VGAWLQTSSIRLAKEELFMPPLNPYDLLPGGQQIGPDGLLGGDQKAADTTVESEQGGEHLPEAA
jgi:hypothetical protein